jgi:hypothetical protein
MKSTAASRIGTVFAALAVGVGVIAGSSGAALAARVGTTPPTLPPPTAPVALPTAPVPTIPAPTVPVPTVPVPTVPVPTVPVPTTGAVAVPTIAPAASGNRTVIDDTGLLTVTVPGDWVEDDLRPGLRNDGGARPSLTVTPNIDAYDSGWDTPGVFFVAFPVSTAPATVVTNRDWSGSCTDGGRTPFNDGRFVGEIRLWTACGGGTARFIVLGGTAVDGSVTLMVEILAPTADDAAASMILGTFGTVAGVTYQPVAPVAVPAPIGVADPLLLQGPVQPGAVTVADDTGHFSVAVPAEWADVNPIPAFNDDLSDRPRLRVSTDLTAMNETWTAPGLISFVVPAVDPGRLLVNQDLSKVCTDGGLQTFDNGVHRGFLRVWSACGGTATRVVDVAVTPVATPTVTMFVSVQLPTADDTPLKTVLASMTYR